MAWAVVILAAVLAVALWVSVGRLRRSREDADTLRQSLDELLARVSELESLVATPRAPDPLSEPLLRSGHDTTLIEQRSGLYNEQFFRVTLDARVSAARRHLRPVAVVLVQVSAGVREGNVEPTDPSVVGDSIRATVRDADTACRLDDGRYVLVLEDTPENGAVWTVERIRRALAAEHPGQTLWAGIACYPAHAFDATGLFDRAGLALAAATEWRQDRIEVATADA